jgi:hypothetical protein
MHPDIAVIAPAAALNPMAARSLLGLAGVPTIVAMGPFGDQAHAEQLVCHGMGCRARAVARKYRLQRPRQRNDYA